MLNLQNPSKQARNKKENSFLDAGSNPAGPIQTMSAEHLSVMQIRGLLTRGIYNAET